MEINSRVINVKTTKLAAAGNRVGPETGRKPASAAGDDPYAAENTHIKVFLLYIVHDETSLKCNVFFRLKGFGTLEPTSWLSWWPTGDCRGSTW